MPDYGDPLPGSYAIVVREGEEVRAARVRIGPMEILDLMSGCDEEELRAQGRFWEIGQRRKEWRALPAFPTVAEAQEAIRVGTIPSRTVRSLLEVSSLDPLMILCRKKVQA